MMTRNGERYAEAEISRIRGVLALKQIQAGQLDAAEVQAAQLQAERWFREAGEIAHRQGAKLYEIRAGTDLGRLLTQTGRRAEALRSLGGIYDSLTEGFDTPDIQNLKRALEEAM